MFGTPFCVQKFRHPFILSDRIKQKEQGNTAKMTNLNGFPTIPTRMAEK